MKNKIKKFVEDHKKGLVIAGGVIVTGGIYALSGTNLGYKVKDFTVSKIEDSIIKRNGRTAYLNFKFYRSCPEEAKKVLSDALDDFNAGKF